MSKGIEYWYSKWDKIELSDDEDDVHLIVDKESWISASHRSRVEREREEAIEIKENEAATSEANHRIEVLKHDLNRLEEAAKVQDVDSGTIKDGDDDLEDAKGIKAKLDDLMQANELRNKRIVELGKLKALNVDNICKVKEERTIINTNAAEDDLTPTGFSKAKEDLITEQAEAGSIADGKYEKAVAATSADTVIKTPAPACAPKSAATTEWVQANAPPPPPPEEVESYLEFVAKYSKVVEDFTHLQSLEASKKYILKYGDVLLQENATMYLLFACLEHEINGHRQKMKQTCRQTRIMTSIADLAVSKQQHPGNVVIPFFKKFEQKEFHVGFSAAVEGFCRFIIIRAAETRMEIDRARMKEDSGRAVGTGRIGPDGGD
jgi:hypothetical protein